MAKVWFVRRHGGRWIAPGGDPAFNLPLASIQFPLDLGPHRHLGDERPQPAPETAREDPASLQRVMVELFDADLDGRDFSGFRPGFYDSGLSPREAAQRLSSLGGG
jgi:hypothetical protein